MHNQDISYLDIDEVIQIHEKLIGLTGGMFGIRDRGALESSLAQPKMIAFGKERFPNLIEKAAAYCFFIVRNHPFFDGNKRTGLVAAITFLLDHGVKPIFDEDEMYKVIIGVAKGEMDVDELSTIFHDTISEQD